jgi:hypothetical protein
MRNTCQRNGTFYLLRLLIPKALPPYVTKSKVVQGLNTKDRRQAYLRSMEASLAFEKWVRNMKNKFGIGDDNGELIVSRRGGRSVERNCEPMNDMAYASGQGGGARIVDKFGDAREEFPAALRCAGNSSRAETGQRCSAASEVMDAA